MKTQFVTFEIALKLKELGFDEECLAYFRPEYEIVGDGMPEIVSYQVLRAFSQDFHDPIEGLRYSEVDSDSFCGYLFAPLWQQVIDWLWNNYKILVYPYLVPYTTKTIMWVTKYQYEDFWSNKEQAILKAIEIIKNKQS